MRFGLFVPPFHDLADAGRVAELAAAAERGGWDGMFLWDHMLAGAGTPIADPWVALTAMALSTTRLTLGPLVTPLARRRPWVLARQVATLAGLCPGRLVLGVGLGDDGWAEFSSFGELVEPVARGELLSESLQVLTGLLAGQPVRHAGARLQVDTTALLPVPVQPVPLWGACRWPRHRSLARAARLAGCFPIFAGSQLPALPAPETVAEVRAALSELGADPGSELVLRGVLDDLRPARVAELEQAGASWLLAAVDPARPDPVALGRLAGAGPPR